MHVHALLKGGKELPSLLSFDSGPGPETKTEAGKRERWSTHAISGYEREKGGRKKDTLCCDTQFRPRFLEGGEK